MRTIEIEVSDKTWQQAFALLAQFNEANERPLTLQEYLEFVLRIEIDKRYKGNPAHWQQSRFC
jgi:hypothetical protein